MNAIAPSTAPVTRHSSARYRHGIFASESERHTAFLDAAVPLKSGSHADVVRYVVDVPMRYAECFAVLRNGRTVPLANKRSFKAWSGREALHSLMFEVHGLRIEAMIDEPGHIAGIDIQSAGAGALTRRSEGATRQFIAVDGAIFA